MVTRVSPNSYLGVVDNSQDYVPPQPVVNNYYTQGASLDLPEAELAQIKFLIIGLSIGLALGIAICLMMREKR
jgi:hypothetical protein